MIDEPKRQIADEPDFVVYEYKADDLLNLNVFSSEIAIAFCSKGQAEIKINGADHTFRSGTNFTIRRSQHLYIESFSSDAQITIIDYSFKFFSLIHHILEKSILDALNKNNTPHLCTLESLEASNATILKIVNLFKDTYHTNRNRYLVSLSVSFFLERYEALVQCQHIKNNPRDNEVNAYVTRFRQLCDRLHMKERNIKVYAAQLGISPRHLYEVVKGGTGLTPKQILTNYIVATAKRLLLTSTLSTQQIAFTLNFAEQSNFSQYFKQNVGYTPSEFRTLFFKANSKNKTV